MEPTATMACSYWFIWFATPRGQRIKESEQTSKRVWRGKNRNRHRQRNRDRDDRERETEKEKAYKSRPYVMQRCR
jgi:hypothetical protein